MAKDFFMAEEKKLQKKYPGINWRRFKVDFEVYLLSLNYNSFFSGEFTSKAEAFFDQTLEGTPLEYITNRSYFYKSEFVVNDKVLIPRSETEILVELALSDIKKISKTSEHKICIADIGTGSGCIGLSIAAASVAPLDILLTDISEEALKVAKLNNFRLNFKMNKQTNINFKKSDRLLNIKEKFHLIVSNPPYIKKEKDERLVHAQVHKFEPHLALYLKASSYDVWFSEFFSMVKSSLNVNGIFLMEGHENHLCKLKSLAEKIGLKDVKILPDLTGADRFLRAIKLESQL